MFDRHVRKSVNLPVIRDDDDYLYCCRLVNEALLELDHNGTGPVHINVPMKYYSTSFPLRRLPGVPAIERLDWDSSRDDWMKKVRKLEEAKRILVVCGQENCVSPEQQDQMSEFFHAFNSALAVDYMSNVECEGMFNPSVCMDTRFISDKKFNELLPDIVISYGGMIFSGLKAMLLRNHGKFEHWLIQPDGMVCDPFKSLTTIFACKPDYFFDFFVENTSEETVNDRKYYQEIMSYAQTVKDYDFPWSNVYAIKNMVTRIPSGSLLHLSINSSIRITNFFTLNPDISVYANIGTHGIDGCLPSFLGQSVANVDTPSYLIIGDLSFFYGMNALRSRHIGNNVRILLLNNRGGEEFYYNGMWRNAASDLHTTARHSTKAEGWAKECGFTYLSACDKKSYDEAIGQFMGWESERPILFEVFTEMSTDSQIIYDFYDASRPRDLVSEAKRKGKELVKNTVGKEKVLKVAQTLGISLK